MRYAVRFLMMAALVLPFGLVVAEHSAGAAAGTTCSKSSGTATFKPALPVVGSSQTVKPTVTVKGGKTTGCKGGGVTSATFASLTKFHDPTNCSILLSGNPTPHPPTGTLTSKWNTGATSVAAVTLNTVSGQPTQTHITGKVTSGLFSGLSLAVTLSFTPKTGNCTSTPLSAVTFKQVTALKIS
jgi:hypothetical protein